MDFETKISQTWTLAKSWKPCRIGMLPRAIGSSGCLPILDIIDNDNQNQVSERKKDWKLMQHGTKRDATLDLPQLNNSTVKKMRETKNFEVNNELRMQGVKGCLMVGGVWKKIMEEELVASGSSDDPVEPLYLHILWKCLYLN
ncbi:hypothetical protein RJT34_11097 [Clitoria ternatea]|uniref:Uncharacterized protein n=1 Tax=Clitoria ternatea TaxID=43366 RepID=A0AAN9JLF4_CLITE